MIRKAIIKRNINTSEEIHHVVGHNGSVFFEILFKYFCYLAVVVIVFLLLNRYLTRPYLRRVFAGIWLIFFLKFCIDFCDIYLDCLVMTDSWITLYMWEWLLEYKTEHFDWDSVETISFNQKWIRDTLFKKWDITITLEHWIQYPFENISRPKKQADIILQLKNRFSTNNTEPEDPELESQKFDVLVEALWEVVKDYIDKDKSSYDY